jgi:hypothetical protein
MRPDLILSDLVTIFHSDASSSAQSPLSFYRRLRPLTDNTGVGSCDVVDLPRLPQPGHSFLWAKFNVSRLHQVQFLDILHTEIKEEIAAALDLASDRFEVFVSNDPPPSADDTNWVLDVNVNAMSCGNCGDDGPEQLNTDCLGLARRLDTVHDVILSALRSFEPTVTVAKFKPVHVVCTAGNAVALSALHPEPATSNSEKGELTSSQTAGIVVGSVLTAVLIVIAALLSWRAGNSHAYKVISSSSATKLGALEETAS